MSLARRAVAPAARSQTKNKPFAAPVLGWVSAQNPAAAKPGTATVMENWFPTETGVKLMGGSRKHATVHATDPCESLMAYEGVTGKLFGAAAGSIFDITTVADAGVVPTADVTGQTSDYYAEVQFETVGGRYMFALNGDDFPQLYDGTSWYPVKGTDLKALAFDAQTGNFTLGLTLTGGTSGATGVIERQTDGGATGTLYLRTVTGTFQDNETITDSGAGSATANGVASTVAPAITGVTTSHFSQGTVYANRIFFVEYGTMNVWALPVDSIGGAAIQISLAGVFHRGGAVLFVATWSLDAGDGLDDKFVVVSTLGEVAIYQGINPADADEWSLSGQYDIARPLGKNGYMHAGGDLIILTEEGAIPISQAVVKDRAAISLAAISRRIAPDWTTDARQRSNPWEIIKWPSQSMALVATPVEDANTDPWCYIVNTSTGAWCKRVGWDTRCFALHGNQVYFGTSDGKVMQANVSGADDGASYECKLAAAWDHLGLPGHEKTAVSMRAQFRAAIPFTPQLSTSVNYAVSFPSPPNVNSDSVAQATWDVSEWDDAEWDVRTVQSPITTRWESISGQGTIFAPQVQVTCGSSATPDAELQALDFLFELNELMV